MKLYIAAPISQASAAEELAGALHVHGIAVTSTWHHEVLAKGILRDAESDEERRECDERNRRELIAADGLVVLAHRGTPGQTYVEVGQFKERRRWLFDEGSCAERPLWIVWTHGTHGEGRRLADSSHGVRRVLVADDTSPIIAAVREMHTAWKESQ